MERRHLLVAIFIALALGLGLNATVPSATAESPASGNRAPRTEVGTAFSYQGRLKHLGNYPTGAYDFEFKLYDALTNGNQVGVTVLKDDQNVVNGMFTVWLDFGDVFDGTLFYLQVGTRMGGSTGAYTILTPRHGLLPKPYALYAKKADLLDGQHGSFYQQRVAGTCAAGNAVRVVNANGTVTCEPVGSGGGWSLTGNTGTNPTTHFLGTTDAQALEFKVENRRVLRIEPHATSPNIIGGYSGNNVTAAKFGATIGGGGASGYRNSVTDLYGTISGGRNNQAAGYASVGGGGTNIASDSYSTVSGGSLNTASNYASTVGGGESNTASGNKATIGGGYTNSSGGDAATVGGGDSNSASGWVATVAGGHDNTASGSRSTVPGGSRASASHYGEMAYASGYFAAQGDAQTSVYVLRGTTTNTASPTELFLDGAGASQRVTIANNRTVAFDILVVGRSSSGGESAGYQIRGVIEQLGASVLFAGSPTVTDLGEDIPGWGVSVEANGVQQALVIKATGDAARTIRWVATVRTSEVNW